MHHRPVEREVRIGTGRRNRFEEVSAGKGIDRLVRPERGIEKVGGATETAIGICSHWRCFQLKIPGDFNLASAYYCCI